MIHNTPPPFGHTIFCDDVRVELGNKVTLVGVYSQSMQFAHGTPYPIVIAKLGVATYWREPAENHTSKISFKTSLAEIDAGPDSELEELAKSPELNVDQFVLGMQMHPSSLMPFILIPNYFLLSPLVVPKESKVRVTILRDGELWAAGALRIFNVPPSPT